MLFLFLMRDCFIVVIVLFCSFFSSGDDTMMLSCISCVILCLFVFLVCVYTLTLSPLLLLYLERMHVFTPVTILLFVLFFFIFLIVIIIENKKLRLVFKQEHEKKSQSNEYISCSLTFFSSLFL